MSKYAAVSTIRKALKTSAGQTAGKTAAVVGGGTVAAYAIPTAAGAGLRNLGGKNETATNNTAKGVSVLAVLLLLGVGTAVVLNKVIK